MNAGEVHRVWIGLGSNVGDRQVYLDRAGYEIEQESIRIISHSGIYESDPWGFQSEKLFCNKCIHAETNLDPRKLLDTLKSIEKRLGRETSNPEFGYTDRIIDLDLLFYDELVMHTDNLIIPHPHIEERLFVLKPLCEIAPGKIHPLLGKSVKEILEDYTGKERVIRLTRE